MGNRGQEAPWAGLAIATMWIAVLCIGLWGGDIVTGPSVTNGTSGSSVPVVVVVAPCALIATIIIARRAFGGSDRS